MRVKNLLKDIHSLFDSRVSQAAKASFNTVYGDMSAKFAMDSGENIRAEVESFFLYNNWKFGAKAYNDEPFRMFLEGYSVIPHSNLSIMIYNDDKLYSETKISHRTHLKYASLKQNLLFGFFNKPRVFTLYDIHGSSQIYNDFLSFRVQASKLSKLIRFELLYNNKFSAGGAFTFNFEKLRFLDYTLGFRSMIGQWSIAGAAQFVSQSANLIIKRKIAQDFQVGAKLGWENIFFEKEMVGSVALRANIDEKCVIRVVGQSNYTLFSSIEMSTKTLSKLCFSAMLKKDSIPCFGAKIYFEQV